MNLKSNEGFLITIKKPDLTRLKAECYSEIIKHYAKGHEDIKAQIRICFFRKRYLMISKIVITGVDKETNKTIEIYKGSNDIEKYAVAKWKFDHARTSGSKFDWNVIEFECDGDNVRANTSFDEEVLKAAEADVSAGIINRTLTSIVRLAHGAIMGKYRKEEE